VVRIKSSPFRLAWLAAALLLLAAARAGLSAEDKPPAADARVARLIEQLGDRDYTVRQRAQEELAKVGFAAYDALVAASEHRDLEVASRARYLLRLLRSKWSTDKDPPRVKEALDGYDLQGPEGRADRIRLLALYSDLEGVPALGRLIRFEKSPVLASYAAAAILTWEPPDAASRKRLAEILRENLAGSSRPGAQWLMLYLQLREEPKKAVGPWARLVEAERTRLERSPRESSAAIVVPLVYALAEAYARQGDQTLAEQTAEQALKIHPTIDGVRLHARLEAAASLRRRGRFAWARRECQQLIDSGNPKAALRGGRELGEMLHDQGNHKEAAEACQKALDTFRAKEVDWGDLAEDVKQARARVHYFLACRHGAEGDRARQRQELETALKEDPGELDALIAAYRLAGQSAEFRAKIVRQVQQEADAIRRDTAEEPNDPENYNKFAWLVGNTEGNLDEALKSARKSLELSPNTSAYLDTLAHVYFTRGDLENAVKYQSRAAELEPHSGLIVRELEAFRKALEAKQKPRRPE